jgi:hypothetical protein
MNDTLNELLNLIRESDGSNALTDIEIKAIEFFGNPNASINCVSAETLEQMINAVGGPLAAADIRAYSLTAKSKSEEADYINGMFGGKFDEIVSWVHELLDQLVEKANLKNVRAATLISDDRLLTSEILMLRQTFEAFTDVRLRDFLACVAEAIVCYPSTSTAKSSSDTLRAGLTETIPGFPPGGVSKRMVDNDSSVNLKKWLRIREDLAEDRADQYLAASFKTRLGLTHTEVAQHLGRDREIVEVWVREVNAMLATS